MKKFAVVLLMGAFLIAVLGACSPNAGSQGQDPTLVKIELSTQPSPVKALQKTHLVAQVTGLVKEEGARVEFDIRDEDNIAAPEIIKATPNGTGGYTIEKTFAKPELYIVYIHLYQDDLHIMKKKQLEVS